MKKWLVAAFAALALAATAQAGQITWGIDKLTPGFYEWDIFDSTPSPVFTTIYLLNFSAGSDILDAINNRNFSPTMDGIITSAPLAGTFDGNPHPFVTDSTDWFDNTDKWQDTVGSSWDYSGQVATDKFLFCIFLLFGEQDGDEFYLYAPPLSNVFLDENGVMTPSPHGFTSGMSQSGFNFRREVYIHLPIPEPATGLLVLGGAAVLLLRRRRR